MNPLYKKWQNEWRQIMGLPFPVDKDPKSDWDIIFGLWELEKDAFFQLFSSFPRGNEIAQRAYELRWGNSEELNGKLSEEEIIVETQEAIEILQKIQPCEDLKDPEITFIKKSGKDRLKYLTNTDPLSIEVDDEISTFIQQATGDLGESAYYFLSEPFYQMSTSYIPARWILWCLTDLRDQNPYTPLMKLQYNQCDAALTEDGVLIFQSED